MHVECCVELVPIDAPALFRGLSSTTTQLCDIALCAYSTSRRPTIFNEDSSHLGLESVLVGTFCEKKFYMYLWMVLWRLQVQQFGDPSDHKWLDSCSHGWMPMGRRGVVFRKNYF